MDIDKTLSHFISKEDMVSFIRDLSADSTGVLCFRCPSDKLDEDGNELELVMYKSYGDMSTADAVLLGHEIIDLARGL
jgi:hypothetical protein